MKEQIESICTSCSQKIHFEDYTDVPEHFIAAADVFCLPSYREGFGVVIIQAASAGIPSIGTRIYGVADTIEDGYTGFLYDARDIDGLTLKMIEMIAQPDLRKIMGENARLTAHEKFSKERVTTAFSDYYKTLLHINN
jgi:glycosyltransferase involved in cell wall biosynthesis